MSDDRRGMGRGLAAILPRPGDEDGLREIPVDLIDPNPRQPRSSFDETKLAELAESIRARGVLQPIVVRPLAGGRYELVAGERRLRAARIAELDLIPAMLRQADDWERLDLALAENMARAEPERGRGGARLRDARRRPRPHQGGGRPPGRPQPRRDLQPDPPARPPRGGARADRVRPPHARATAGRSCSARTTPRAGGWRAPPATAPGRCARPSGAPARPRPARPTPPKPKVIHPDLAEALAAAEDTLSAALGRDVKARARGEHCVVEIEFDQPGGGRRAGPLDARRGRAAGRRESGEPPLQSAFARPTQAGDAGD